MVSQVSWVHLNMQDIDRGEAHLFVKAIEFKGIGAGAESVEFSHTRTLCTTGTHAMYVLLGTWVVEHVEYQQRGGVPVPQSNGISEAHRHRD